MLSGASFADEYVDGKKFDEFEVTQWDGIDAPSLSAANTARMYYDTTADKLMLSVNGGAYSDISAGGGGTWGSITGTLSSQSDLFTALSLRSPIDHQHPKYDSSAVFAAIDHQHPYYGAADHQHPSYGAVDHQHPAYGTVSWVSSLSEAFMVHSHPTYSTATTTLSNAYTVHGHPQYLPTTYTNQHDASYPGISNFTTLAGSVFTNAHPQYAPLSSMTHTHIAYAPISHAHGQYAPMSSMTHSHSSYAPISHAHTTYVPYSGATSTLNMGSQHMVASAAEVNNIRVNTHVLFTPGQTQSATGIVMSGQAGEALSFGDVVYCKSNGKYYKAKADSNATIPAVAMAVSSAAANGYVSLLVNGFAVNSSWNFMAGCHVLVSPYTGEAITHSKVTVTGYQAQIVGYATSSTTIYFKPDYTYVEI